ncbi:MAG: hypothetical protein HZC05_01260 [Candidatus Magasanikbacteria bacterium]|nr:hypothetical protein [Candidatus Magasanikbacteria bacterium]
MEEIMGKYDEWSRGDDEALLNRLGIETARRIASGELQVQIVNGVAVVKPALVTLFDKRGRRIPQMGLKRSVVDANRDFHLKQPKLDYGRLIALATERLQQGPIMSGAEFEARATAILTQVKADKKLANLLKSVHLPIVLPQMMVNDYGKVLDDVFLAAVERAYTAAFPGRPFNNYRKGDLAGNDLAGKVTIVPDTRHEQLIAKMAAGTVVGIYFPTALQGFSVPATREQMASLPDNVILSGGLDIATAMTMYPEVLARDWHTPGLDMAALQWSSADYSLFFRATDSDLNFSHRDLDVDGTYSGGLLLLGPACR